MKFLPENRKKSIWSIILLVISTGGIVYINFFTGSSKKTIVTPDQINQAFSNSGQPVPSDLSSPPIQVPEVFGGLLPYGAKIDLRILQDERFKVLKEVPKVTVSAEELGKTDLFFGE